MKRFTETEKWRDPWFRKLSPAMKCFWSYLTDHCDHAGVWEVDFETASFFVGETLVAAKVIEAFQERIERLPEGPHGSSTERWRVIKFVSFQYPSLSRDCKPHKPVFAAIERHGLDEVKVSSGDRIYGTDGKAFNALPVGFENLQVKEKEKEKEKAADRKPRPESKPRERNPLLDTLALLETKNLQEVTNWPKHADALKTIKSVAPDVTPEEINRRAANYRVKFKDAMVTSKAISNNWHMLATASNAPQSAPRRPENIPQFFDKELV